MHRHSDERLVEFYLEGAIQELEKDAALNRYNTSCIRALANASTLLRRADVAGRAFRLLKAAPDEGKVFTLGGDDHQYSIAYKCS